MKVSASSKNQKILNPLDPLFTTHIETLSHDGRGIAHIDGKTTFINNALINETVKIQYLRRHHRYNEANVVEVISPSPLRAEPQCPHTDICGACSLQHMQHDAQLEHKQKIFLEQFQHFGHIEIKPENLLPPITAPIWGYRRKARLSVRFVEKKEKLLVGFHEKNGRYIAILERCEILHPSIGQLIMPLRTLIADLDNYRHIPQLEVAVGDDASALIIRHVQPLSQQDKEKIIAFAKQHHLHIYLQPKNIDSIHRLYPTEGRFELNYYLPHHDLELLFHPTDFIQINAAINTRLINTALELLELTPNDHVLDLFCGLGNFTLPIAKYCKQVVGIEGNKEMVTRAQNNAKHNHIENADFFVADLFQSLSDEPWTQQTFTKVMIDPPRSGALEIIQALPRFNPQRIVYVSCHPATLARDANELISHQGYRLTRTGIVDMFPHTKHMEAIAIFEK